MTQDKNFIMTIIQEIEANNDMVGATPGAMGDTFSGSLANGDIDVFKFHAGAGGVVTIDFNHPKGAITSGIFFEIQLLDAQGSLVASQSADRNSTFKSTISESGDYFLRVIDGNTSYDTQGGTYKITPSLTTDANTVYDGADNNDASSAVAVQLGQAICGSLNNQDIDVFKFHANSGGIVNIDFAHPKGAINSGIFMDMELWDTQGNLVTSKAADGSTSFKTTIAAAGDYIIKIADGNSSYDTQGGLYKITPTLTNTVNTVYDGADNNDATSALAVQMGQAICGSLNNQDSDVFKFHVNSGGIVNIDFAHPKGAINSGIFMDMELWDTQGNLVTSMAADGSTSFKTTIAAGGDYIFKITDGNSSYDTQGGLYKITPTLTKTINTVYDGADNNDGTSALEVQMGQAICGSLNNQDSDVFKIHANAGGIINIDFTHPKGAINSRIFMDMELWDTQGNLVTSKAADGSTSFKTTIATGGDYIFKITDGNSSDDTQGGLYQITPTLASASNTVYDGADNNDAGSALAVRLGQTICGSLNNQDTDAFQFHADLTGLATFNFTHPKGTVSSGIFIDLELSDAQGNVIVSRHLDSNGSFDAGLTAGGDYILKITDGNSSDDTQGGLYQITTTLGTTLNGSSANDILSGTDANQDRISGMAGNDNLKGLGNNDVLSGGEGNDTLDGGSGNDILDGGTGSDTVSYASAGAGITASLSISTAQDTEGAGVDTLSNIENITGSRFDDVLTGNASANILNGGTGADVMMGRGGSDIYTVDNVDDLVRETIADTATGGTDQVNSYLADYTLTSYIENGRILSAGTAGLNGNGLNNLIYAGTGNNAINGGAGTDTVSYLYGVAGTTGVTVNLALGTAQNTLGSGVDTLANIENLVGSSYADTLGGNSGANLLAGGNGNDILTGGTGQDVFRFDTAPSAANIDTIRDFSVPDDTIQLENSVFTRLATGTLAAGNFVANNAPRALDANDFILYDKDNGILYYDDDGSGVHAAVKFALIGANLNMTAADFLVT